MTPTSGKARRVAKVNRNRAVSADLEQRAKALARYRIQHYGCVHSIGYCANRGEE